MIKSLGMHLYTMILMQVTVVCVCVCWGEVVLTLLYCDSKYSNNNLYLELKLHISMSVVSK